MEFYRVDSVNMTYICVLLFGSNFLKLLLTLKDSSNGGFMKNDLQKTSSVECIQTSY